MTTLTATPTANHTPVRQRGAVLAISLLVLLVMTVLGVAAMGSTTLQERMANNNRQQQVAFQAAEAALRAAENYLGNTINSVTALNVNFNSAAPMIGLYSQRAPMTGMATYPLPAGFDIYDDNDWLAAGNAVKVNTVTSVTQRPRYLIEYVGRVGPPPNDYNGKKPDTRQYGFRVTAIGWGEGAAPNARHLLQSSYRIPL
ncbi:MAG: pilus assembly PilX family protein [Thiogranum sp.]